MLFPAVDLVVVDCFAFCKSPFSTVGSIVASPSWPFINLLTFRHVVYRLCRQFLWDLFLNACYPFILETLSRSDGSSLDLAKVFVMHCIGLAQIVLIKFIGFAQLCPVCNVIASNDYVICLSRVLVIILQKVWSPFKLHYFNFVPDKKCTKMIEWSLMQF